MKILFETTDCGRCGGCGEYSFNLRDGKRCFGCGGSGKVLSRAGRAARKIYDQVMEEMNVPANTVQAGDHVMYNRKWRKVHEAGPTTSGKINQENVLIHAQGINLIVGATDLVKRFDQEIARKAGLRVSKLKGVEVIEP